MNTDRMTGDINSVSNKKKRSTAEISEDEASNRPSPSYKKKRSTRVVSSSDSTPSSSMLSDDDEYSRGLAPANTSTDHILALTGAKGPSMCLANAVATKQEEPTQIYNTTDDMTPEERKDVHRARNRVHARNTRIRRQCYIEELQRTLLKMLAERDAEHQSKNQLEADKRNIRYNVLEEFLCLSQNKATSYSRWSAILKDDIQLELPNANSSQKALSGFTESIKKSLENPLFDNGRFSIQCHQDTFVVDGTKAVLDWTATTPDHSQVKIRGVCRATFNPKSNKLDSVSLVYDSAPAQNYL